MTVRVKHLTSSVADLRKISETSARKFWATWTRGKTCLKISASDFYTHEKRWEELLFNKISTTFMSSLFMVDMWEMSSFLEMDIYGNPNLRTLSHQATCRHTPKDFILIAARTLNHKLQPPFDQHTNVSVYCQQYKGLKYGLLWNKFVSYSAFLNFILFFILSLQILQG
jgi:hypothetical protein